MSDFAWFCLMIMVAVVAGNGPQMIRAWRCCCEDEEES